MNCSYCYVYNRGDDSWRTRPAYVSDAVVQQLGYRISEHCARYGLSSFTVELHGGEPLLLGKGRFAALVENLRLAAEGVVLTIVMQTNGLLLDRDWLDIFEEQHITFGLSVDGPVGPTDHRVRLNGRGSTRELLALIAHLRESDGRFSRLNSGALCVIDPTRDGAESVRWFAGLGFRAFDFLLPDGNYANLPADWTGPAPYRRFMLEALSEWYQMGADAPRIRTFEVMMRAFAGVKPELDALGGDLSGLCVIESDGSIGVSDVARICGGRFSRDELSLFEHPLDLHARSYDLADIQVLSDTCRNCRYLANCGGGYFPHRFDGESFANPSIYCAVLYAIAESLYEKLRRDLPPSLWRETSGNTPAAHRHEPISANG